MNAPREDRNLTFSQYSTTLFLPGPRTRPVYLVKVAIAAKFNHIVPYGGPFLQVRRRNSSANGSFNSVYITRREPKPTEYLNVFEYDLSENRFEIYPEEQICLSWFPSSSHSARYSLAYDKRGAMAMGFIENVAMTSVPGDSGQPLPTNNSTQSRTTTSSAELQTSVFTTEIEIVQSKQPDALEATTAIVGGVLCTIMLIVLLTVLTITVFVVFRCRNHTKNFSPNGNDLSASVLPVSSTPIIQNPTYSLVDSEFQTINYCKDRGIVNFNN